MTTNVLLHRFEVVHECPWGKVELVVPVEFEESLDSTQRKFRMIYRADGTKEMVKSEEGTENNGGGNSGGLGGDGGGDAAAGVCGCACLCGEKETQWVKAKIFEHKMNNKGGCAKCDRRLQVRTISFTCLRIKGLDGKIIWSPNHLEPQSLYPKKRMR